MIALLSIALGISSIKGTSDIMQDEASKLSKQVLNEIGNNISILLSNVEVMINNISIDSRLIKILSIPKEDLHNSDIVEKANFYVQNLLLDKVFSNSKSDMKPELYIVGENGLSYSTYSKTKYDLDGLKKSGLYDKIVNSHEEITLINTYEDKDGVGPYKYIFKMGKAIRNLITGDIKGILVIDVSENMLYQRYYENLKDGRNIYIVDSTGKIISAKDKRQIGHNYKKEVKDANYNIIKRDNKEFMKIKSTINKFGWSIIEEVPMDIINRPIYEMNRNISMIVILLLILALIITYKLSVLITKPILQIKDKMVEVMNGNLKVNIKEERDDEIGELEVAFNSMVKKLDYYIEEIKNTEKQKRLAELSFLQAQINPHFLYNTLSSIRFMISMGRNEEAEDMIYRFTKLLRSILPKASELITLYEEMENIKNYVELQKMRYPNCFAFNCDIEEGIENIMVPAFILQPIVENAIIYSMEKENNRGIISVVAYKSEKGISIVVKDNGIGIPKNKIKSLLKRETSINRVGLINVHERIQLNYGKEYGLNIDSVEGKGTKVIFALPD